MWKETDIAYLAGIIDGEGSIYIQKRITKAGHISYFPRFQVVNTNRDVMNWIKNTFGGLLYDKPRIKHNIKWKTQIEWFTTRSLLDKLIPLLLPYLIIKKQHCIIMMQFRETFKNNPGSKGVSNEIQDFRFDCLQKIKHLNHPL